QDFKVHLAQDLARLRSDVPIDDDLLATLARRTTDEIRNTVQAISRQEFHGAAGALAAARSVLVTGVAASAVTALELEYRLTRLGISATATSDVHMQRVRSTLLGAEDVAVFVSFSGATRDLLAAAKVAKDARARIICLTNYRLSPLCEVADYRLITAIDADPLGSEIASRVANSFLVDALCRQITSLRQGADTVLMRTSEAVGDAQL
ncbi:MAG TPA: MurR/RpiR family transcriptional regulator, partial [Armatimonadota bacterium]